jgi:hypothetical protein
MPDGAMDRAVALDHPAVAVAPGVPGRLAVLSMLERSRFLARVTQQMS